MVDLKRGSRRRRNSIILGLCLLFVGLIILWLYINNAPAIGKIKAQPPQPSQSLETKKPTLVPYTANPYIKYSYLSNYRLVNTSLDTEGVLSRALFTAELPADVQFNLYTQKFSGFDQDGAVHYRESFPNLYRKEVLSSNGLSGLIFTRTDQGFERVAFIVKGNLETVFSMTVNSQDPQFMNDYQQMLNTVAWR